VAHPAEQRVESGVYAAAAEHDEFRTVAQLDELLDRVARTVHRGDLDARLARRDGRGRGGE